jgi:hypothetical protein
VQREDLQAVVDGDMTLLADLAVRPWAEIEACGNGQALLLTRHAVAGIVRGLQRGDISGAAAQRWASFVRRGYLSTAATRRPIKPLDIEYETQGENAIVEVLARLDSIGDAIDGEVPTDQEAADLLALLAP